MSDSRRITRQQKLRSAVKRGGPRRRSEDMEQYLDDLANDGRLGIVAKRIAIEAGNDWPSLNGDEQDEWHEEAIRRLRAGTEESPP